MVHHPQECVSAVAIPTSPLRELTGSPEGSREKEGCRGREEEGGAACAPPPSGPAGGAARRQRRRRAHGAAASPAPLRLRPGLLPTLRSSPGSDAHLPGKCHLGPLPPRPTIAATPGATAAAEPSFLALSVSSRLWLQLRLRLRL